MFWSLLFLAGFSAGFINVIAGGGSFLVLALLMLAGIPSSVANATNRVSIMIQNSVGVYQLHTRGVRDDGYSLRFVPVSIVGSVIGAYMAISLSDRLLDSIISVVILISSVVISIDPYRRFSRLMNHNSHQRLLQIAFFFIGVYGGILNAGVGYLMLACLTGLGGLTLIQANYAKLVIALFYTGLALLIFSAHQLVNWPIGFVLAAGSASGAYVSSQLAVRSGSERIRRFIPIIAVMIVMLLWLR